MGISGQRPITGAGNYDMESPSRRDGTGRARGRRPRLARSWHLGDVAFACLILGSLSTGIGPINASIADAVALVSLLLLMLAPRLHLHQQFRVISVSVGVWVTSIVMLSMVLLLGGRGSPLVAAKDWYSYGLFFLGLALLLSAPASSEPRLPAYATVVGILVVVLSQLQEGGARASGVFRDPNLTGSWLASAMVALVVLRCPRRTLLRSAIIAVGAVGLLMAGSFGSLVSLVVGLACVLAIRAGLRGPGQAVTVMASGLVGVMSLPLVSGVVSRLQGLSYDRLGASAEGRESIWRTAIDLALQNPMGLGPGGFAEGHAIDIAGVGGETHNDYLGILVDLGVFGLAVWILILAAMFLCSTKARPLVAMLAVTSMTINAINFRHLWLFVALVIASAMRADKSEGSGTQQTPPMQKRPDRVSASRGGMFINGAEGRRGRPHSLAVPPLSGARPGGWRG